MDEFKFRVIRKMNKGFNLLVDGEGWFFELGIGD